MDTPDHAGLTLDLLNQKRVEAVRLRLAGATLRETRTATGLSTPTIVAAHRAFLTGGWPAVKVRPRGRMLGDGRRIGASGEAQFVRLMLTRTPEQVGVDAALWDANIARRVLHERFGLDLGARSMTNYLARWGLAVDKPHERRERAGEPLRRWHATIYPGIAARAHAEGADILWIDELALRLPAGVQGSAVRAMSNRGKQMWLAYEGVLRAPILIEFFDRLIRTTHHKAFVLLDGMQWHRAAALTHWLADRAERLLAFHLPHGLADSVVALPPARPIAPAPLQFRNADPFAAQVKYLIAQSALSDASIRYPTITSGRKSTTMTLTHLQRLEAESIHIMREVVAETENPVMLYSIGKDSAVMLHLAMKAFYPAPPPFALLHVDTTWKFRAMYEHRDRMSRELGMNLIVHTNPEGVAQGINPFTHGSAIHTQIMKTEALKQALEKYGFDAALGGARRDEEKSRAKERIFSFRSASHRWDPKAQRPELWKVFNARKHKGESIRVFPLSNWTELDIWQYIYLQNIPIPPLYLAQPRPVVERDGMLIMVDDDRMPLREGEVPMLRKVRFRTLGCYPLTAAIESEADTLEAVIQEMLLTKTSERQGRLIDHDSAGSMEKKKQEGYF